MSTKDFSLKRQLKMYGKFTHTLFVYCVHLNVSLLHLFKSWFVVLKLLMFWCTVKKLSIYLKTEANFNL